MPLPLQGSPQQITIDLGRAAIATELCVRFQGGFAGRECVVLAGQEEKELQEVAQLHPNDDNSLQVSSHRGSHSGSYCGLYIGFYIGSYIGSYNG